MPGSRWVGLLCTACAAWVSAEQGLTDPLDETYGRTFHISFNGVKVSEGAELRASMLSQTPGSNTMPRNVKIGWALAPGPFRDTHGPLYDFAANPFGKGAQDADGFFEEGRRLGLALGFHINVMPWGDSANQSLQILHNELEKRDGGIYLQIDSSGRIRNGSKAQEPTANETTGTLGEQLEMQLTLSRNCGPVQDYFARNCRSVARQIEWYRDQYPDQIAYVSMASEYAQNRAANDAFCDYSVWSKQEFRDWLRGTGLYQGQGQFASLEALNTAYAGAPGFPYASFDDVEPPTYFSIANDPSGSWWWKWQAFRVAQVRNIVQRQIDLSREAGVPPDLIFGHQIPFWPQSVQTYDLKYASTWETTFCTGGGGGVTTYNWMAGWNDLFNALYANDKNWGIFEYNPLSGDVGVNADYLNRVWNAKGHVVCPYQWGNTSQPTYLIRGSAFETALQGFVGARFNDRYNGYAPHEGSPASRDVLWAMNESDDVEQTWHLTGNVVAGQFAGTAVTDEAALSLELDETRHHLNSDDYHAVSFRLSVGQPSLVGGKVVWHDDAGGAHFLAFTPRAGTNVYRINLAESADWREKRITRVDFYPGAAADSSVVLDWIRFEARPAWRFDDPNEIYEPTGFSGATVTNGQFRGVTTTTNAFVYLSTDKRSSTEHADRALINANVHTVLRVDLESSASGTAAFRWWTRTSGPHQTEFSVTAGRQTYRLDLSDTTEWTGEVTRLGLSPVSLQGTQIAVHHVNFAPVLLPPRAANNQLIHNTSEPHFQWHPAIEPDHAGLTYDFELATDFEFSNKVATASGILGTAYVVRQTPAPDGFHWWRVRSVDDADNASPWMTPMPVCIRRWNGDYPEEIFLWRGSQPPVFSNGVVSAVSTNTDPYYHFNSAFNAAGTQIANGYRAELYPRFRARLRVAAAKTNNNLQVYAFNDLTNTPAIHSLRSVSFPANNQWVEITVDFSAETNFSGWMRYARIDPSSQSNSVMELDYAELLPPAPPSNTAPVVTCDGVVAAAINTGEAIVQFRVVDAEEPASVLLVTASSSNTNLVRNEDLFLEGTGANRVLRIRPLANRVGSATITVQVYDGTVVSTAQIEVRIPGTALQEWRQLHFGTAAPEGIAGDAVDADDDGWGNLWEFVAGTDPRNSASRPVPALVVQDHFTVGLDRQVQSSNVTLSAEVSYDLVEWYSGPEHVTVLEDTLVKWRVRDNAPAAEAPRRFMRLKATAP
jgi:hypothetical protein